MFKPIYNFLSMALLVCLSTNVSAKAFLEMCLTGEPNATAIARRAMVEMGETEINCNRVNNWIEYSGDLYLGCRGWRHSQPFCSKENLIHSIEPLREFKNIRTLMIGDQPIEDLSVIKDFKFLRTLDISGTNVKDFGFLNGLDGLNSLFVNHIHSFDNSLVNRLIPVLNKLSFLCAEDTGVSDMSFIEKLPNLTSLCVGGQPLRSVKKLKRINYWQDLYIEDAGLPDLAGFAKQTQLSSLSFSHNQIRDLRGLGQFEIQRLFLLDLSFNQIRDLSLIAKLSVNAYGKHPPKYLCIRGNPISVPKCIEQLTPAYEARASNHICQQLVDPQVSCFE